ncbi:hypothetical protein [Leucobacter japonicus]|uniref:hypothetical protein n=1 Tax=Leucobacter japonicus TaxID=1461259 RepID=UPI000B15E3D6|nr:hypothetical protein [Leucobacter japonicus]
MVWNWKLASSTGQVEFGDDENLFVVDSWAVESGKLRVDDRDIPRSDSTRFGQDFRPPASLSFSLWVNGGSEERTLEGLSELAAAWRNDGDRLRSGSMATLQHPRGRFMFGRPREFESDAQRVESGYAKVSAKFQAADDLWYGPEELTRVRFVPPVSGGLTFPAEAPFTFDSGPAERNSSVVVGGDVATWPVFEVFGPVTNPEIEIVGVGRLVFRTTLAYDQFLRVDTRPWARWVQRGYLGSPDVLSPFPGALSPSGSRLSDVSLRPGVHTVVLRGYDPTGSAELGVIRNPAFTSF